MLDLVIACRIENSYGSAGTARALFQLLALVIPQQLAKCKHKDSNDKVVITFVIRCAHSDSVMIVESIKPSG
jgi:hypothetical protein